jgi:hypothetical protein
LARILSSDDLKRLWKGYHGEIGGFRRDKNIQDRIGPSPFLGRPERVMERIPRQETPQSGVSRCYKYGSSKFRDKEIERLRFQFNDFISVIYKIFYRLQRFQKERRKNSGPRNNP